MLEISFLLEDIEEWNKMGLVRTHLCKETCPCFQCAQNLQGPLCYFWAPCRFFPDSPDAQPGKAAATEYSVPGFAVLRYKITIIFNEKLVEIHKGSLISITYDAKLSKVEKFLDQNSRNSKLGSKTLLYKISSKFYFFF